MLSAADDAAALSLFRGEHVGEQVRAPALAVALCGVQDPAGPRSDEGVAIDLTVGVVQGHPDLLTAVLEAVDLLHSGHLQQRLAAGGPGVDHRAHARGGGLCQLGGVVIGEADDFAAPRAGLDQSGGLLLGVAGAQQVRGDRLVAAEGGEAVLEDGDVVLGLRDLAGALRGGGAQRALVAAGQMGAVLPSRGDGHPLLEEGVEAHLVAAFGPGDLPGVLDGPLARLVVEEEDVPPVGEMGVGQIHGRLLGVRCSDAVWARTTFSTCS